MEVDSQRERREGDRYGGNKAHKDWVEEKKGRRGKVFVRTMKR